MSGEDVALRFARAALAAAVIALGVTAYRDLVVDAPPLDADETGHALPAARMALALSHGDLRAFGDACRAELVWPFGQPLLLCPFFLAFGISAHIARLVTLLTYGLMLAFVPALARELWRDEAGERAGPPSVLIGWLSVATLSAAAPWGFISTVMTEPLGMLLPVVTLLVDARAARLNRAWEHFAAGLLGAATFLAKYSFGTPLILALLLSNTWRARRRGMRPLLASSAGACAPVMLWLSAVMLPDPGAHARHLLGILVNRDEGLGGFSGSLFYAKALAASLGWIAAVIAVAASAGAAFSKGRGRRATALLYVALTLVLLCAHPNKQTRYLLPALPPMLVIAEGELARRLGRRPSQICWPLLAALLLVTLKPLQTLRERAADAARMRPARGILAHLVREVAGRQPVLFLGTTGLLPHFALTWEILERQQREPRVDLLTFPGEKDWDPRFRSGYPSAMGPEYALALGRALGSGQYSSVVTLALGERSPFRPDWLAKWDAWGQNYVTAMAQDHPGYALRSERSFSDADAVVRVWVPARPEPEVR